MRPKHKTYSPATEDTDGYVNDATGATTSLTLLATSAGDSLAHQIGVASTSNISTVVFTITGTDADGVALTETVTGVNNSTVETTGYFLTVSSITISATLGAATVDIGWMDEFVTPTIPLNTYVDRATFRVGVTGTINYTVQKTLSDIRTRATDGAFDWSDIEDPAGLIDLSSVTASKDWVEQPCPTAIRLKANSYSTGAVLDLWIVHQVEL